MEKNRKSTMNRSTRQSVSKRAMHESDDGDSDEASGSQPSNRKERMTIAQEDILITVVLKFFDDVENKATDKSLYQSNNKKANDAWAKIQIEFEQKANVSNAHF